MRTASRIRVEEPSQVADGRRAAARMAARAGLDETEIGRVSIVTTELATNLVKHGRGGELVLNAPGSDGGCLEILALDKGKGMENVSRCLEDGYSTEGSSGGGLGAVSRLSSHLEIYSVPNHGTAALTSFRTAGLRTATPGTATGIAVGGISVPMHGEEVCGDAWVTRIANGGISILVADGLGHGPGAAEAAGMAVEVFKSNPDLEPKAMVAAIHAALHNTRGASIGVARLDGLRNALTFAGLGNTCAVIVSVDGTQHAAISHNGTAGIQQAARTVEQFTYPFPEDAIAIFHSDGLATRWKLASYPGLAKSHPTLISGVLYRDFTRGRDDVTVVAARRATG